MTHHDKVRLHWALFLTGCALVWFIFPPLVRLLSGVL